MSRGSASIDSQSLTLRLSPEVRQALDQMCVYYNRTRRNQVSWLIEQALRDVGLLMEPDWARKETVLHQGKEQLPLSYLSYDGERLDTNVTRRREVEYQVAGSNHES